jgi:hypothetical protein
LTFAVRTGQQYGIWGGQPQQVIRSLIALERAGRPTAVGCLPVIPRPARLIASVAIPSRLPTPTTPPTASAAAVSACARPNRPVPADAGEEATQMWRDRDPYREQQHVPDTFWLVVAALCSPPVGWCG